MSDPRAFDPRAQAASLGEKGHHGDGLPEFTTLLEPVELSDTTEVPHRNDKNHSHTRLGAWGVTSMHPSHHWPLTS